MSTLPDSGSRTCASFFPAGMPASGVYLVGNQCSDCGRDPVTLSLSTDGISFDRHFAVRHGVKGADIDHGGSCPRFKGAAKGCGYQYPGAMIDEARKEMIVSYSIGKEDIGLTVFPLSALKSDDGGAAATPLLPGHPQQNGSWSYIGEPWVVSAFGDWAEPVRGVWSEAPEHAIAEDGNFAFFTQTAFTTFSASARFRMLAPWSGAAFVFGAANASSFFQVEFPSTGQQARAEHAWVTLSSVDSAGIRTARYLHGPVGGVTSQPGFEHTMQVTLDESAMLHVRIDGRPIPAYHLPEALESPGYVGFGTYALLGTGSRAAFSECQISGSAVAAPAPPFGDSAPRHVWKNVSAACEPSTSGKLVRTKSGDLLCDNSGPGLGPPGCVGFIRSDDNGKLASPPFGYFACSSTFPDRQTRPRYFLGVAAPDTARVRRRGSSSCVREGRPGKLCDGTAAWQSRHNYKIALNRQRAIVSLLICALVFSV